MRRMKSFQPEWGYLADTTRTIPIVLVATVVGATAGGGVVLSLVDVSANPSSVAATTFASPVQAPMSAPERAHPNQRAKITGEPTMALWNGGPLGAVATGFSVTPKVLEPPGAAASADVAHDNAPVKVATAQSAATAAPVENKATKQHHVAARSAPLFAQFGFFQHFPNGTWGGRYRGVGYY